MTNQEQEPDKNTSKEKVHPIILKLAKIALKDYLVTLPDGKMICREDIELALQQKNIYLNWKDTAELLFPMVAGKHKAREFHFWFDRINGEGLRDCIRIFTSPADDQNKTPPSG